MLLFIFLNLCIYVLMHHIPYNIILYVILIKIQINNSIVLLIMVSHNPFTFISIFLIIFNNLKLVFFLIISIIFLLSIILFPNSLINLYILFRSIQISMLNFFLLLTTSINYILFSNLPMNNMNYRFLYKNLIII